MMPRTFPIPPRVSVRAILVGMGMLLSSGCDKIFCNGSACPTGQHHNSFCGCDDDFKNSSPGATPGGASPGTVLTSACICGQEPIPSQHAIAYFTWKPSQYGNYNQRVHVASSGCQDLTACPIVGEKDEQVVIRGQHTIVPTTWTEYTSLISGQRTWSVQGPVSDGFTDNATPPLSPTFQRASYIAGNFSKSAMAVLFAQADTTVTASSNILDCETECDLNNPSPLCEIAPYPDGIQAPLQKLKTRIGTASTGKISASELLAMFGQKSDDCKRGDTSIDGSKLTNTGDPCWVSTDLAQLKVKAKIDIPTTLTGTVVTSGARVRIAFPDSSQSATLELSDKQMNARFGGTIKSVEADATTVRFGMPRACIAITMAQP
jgi:hypothetical protein